MRSLSLALAVLVATVAEAQTPFEAVHGISAARYETWVSGLTKKGYALSFVSAAVEKDVPIFAAVASEVDKDSRWLARHDLSTEQFQEVFDDYFKEGYRLTCITGYRSGDADRFAAVWVKNNQDLAWLARLNLTTREYQTFFDDAVAKGFRPIQVVGYATGESHRFAAIFLKDGVSDWVARHDLTEPQYQKAVDDLSSKGLYPFCLSVYATAEGNRFAALFQRSRPGLRWKARHNLTSDQYQSAFNELTRKGFRPLQVCAYPQQERGFVPDKAGRIRYAAVFIQESKMSAKLEPLPTSGAAVANLEVFDQAMQKFMSERSVTGGSLAVSRNGKVVFARGYGWSDRERKNLLGPDSSFRLASVSKPITNALVWKLILGGKLKFSDRVLVLLGLLPMPGQKMDPRWADITVEHLLKHEGGWDRAVYDPMFRSLKIADKLGKDVPASSRDVIQYMLGEPLQFDPGSKSVYSNFGYCVLGRVIEKVTGKSYSDALRDELLAPHGIKGVQLGRSLPKYRAANEVDYIDPFRGVNIFDRKGPHVPAPDGTFYLEAMDAHGGLIASSGDVVRFLDHYWIDGQPRKAGERKKYAFFGSIPGTWTVAMQRPDGVNIVALFNQRSDPSGLRYEAIRDILDKAADAVKNWPR